MALGPTHRRFNLFTGVIFFVIVMIATKLDWECMGCFTIAFVLGTFIISPDIDLGPNKYSRWSRFFIYPYSFIFKHRGLSHSIFFGTLSRVLYGLIFAHLIIYIGDALFQEEPISGYYLDFLSRLFFEFDYRYWPHKWLFWAYIGLFCSDFSHILLDSLSSKLKRLF